MSEDLESKIKQLIAEQLNVEMTAIKNSSRFIEDLGADSLDIVELVMAMEESFDLDISDDQAENLLTVAHVLDYIKTAQKSSTN